MTANDVSRLPPEFTRKGRIDEIYGIYLPTHDERLEIFRIHLGLKNRDPDGFDLDVLAPATLAVLALRLEWLAAQKRYDELAGLATNPPAGTPDVSTLRELATTMLASTGDAGNLKSAMNLCRMVVQAEPRRVSAHMNIGQLSMMANDMVAAETAYRQVLEIEPDHQQALNNLAWILGTSAGKPDEALKLADRGVAKYPADAYVRDTRAAILIRLKRLDEAKADLERCLKLVSAVPMTQVNALRQLGQIHAQQGQTGLARKSYDEALKIDQAQHVLSEADRNSVRQALEALPQ